MVELDFKIIEKALADNEIEQEKIDSIIEQIKSQQEAIDGLIELGDKQEPDKSVESDEEKPPRKKKQFNIIVSDPEGKIPQSVELTGWVTQMDEDEPIESALNKIYTAVYDYNATSKSKDKYTTVGDACMNLKSKFFKNAGISIKTKEPIFVQVTNNQIPVV